MAESDTLFDQGKLRESLVFARRAAFLYAPGLAHVNRADARLDSIALGAESARLPRIALLAWQAIRSSELQRREGLGQRRERLLLANTRVSGLVAAIGHGNDGAFAVEERARAELQSKLGEQNVNRAGKLILQLVSLFGTFAGLGTLAWGLRCRPGVSGPALIGAGFALAGAICWAICLVLA
jgi:hypothetical protein